jgi:hypothetical protein
MLLTYRLKSDVITEMAEKSLLGCDAVCFGISIYMASSVRKEVLKYYLKSVAV